MDYDFGTPMKRILIAAVVVVAIVSAVISVGVTLAVQHTHHQPVVQGNK